MLNFLDAAGATTGRLSPTGKFMEVVDGIEVTCIDFASPLVFVAAEAFGRTAHESKTSWTLTMH